MKRNIESKNIKLYHARIDRAWSQERAAEEIGVVRKTYIEWENVLRQPNISLLGDICKAFNMTPHQLGFATYTTYTKPTDITLPRKNISTSVGMFQIGITALALAKLENNWTPEELHNNTQLEMKRLETMSDNTNGVDRRQMLSFLAGLPVAMLGLSSVSDMLSLPVEESLPMYVTAVPAAWKLYFDGHIAEVASILPDYISHLTSLTEHTSRYHETAISLLSQAHQLGSLVVLENEDFGASMAHNKKALSYSQSIDNPDIQLAAYIRQANTLYYRQRWPQMLQTYEEALQTVSIKQASPLVQGRIYSGYGASLCKFEGREQEARRYMAMAHEIFPDQPENDPSYIYMNATQYILHLNDMITLLDIKDAKNAKEALDQASLHVPNLTSPRGVELLNHKAMVASALGDLEETYQHLQQSITLSKSLGSDLYISSARDIIEALPTQWQKEKQVKQLIERLS